METINQEILEKLTALEQMLARHAPFLLMIVAISYSCFLGANWVQIIFIYDLNRS